MNTTLALSLIDELKELHTRKEVLITLLGQEEGTEVFTKLETKLKTQLATVTNTPVSTNPLFA